MFDGMVVIHINIFDGIVVIHINIFRRPMSSALALFGRSQAKV